jgi:hypothetical protein
MPAATERMHSPDIVVIHTSPATIDIFKRLLRERLPGARVANILDDSILPELRDNGGEIDAVAGRWREYVRVAKRMGARVVLNACSSIGELCEPVGRDVGMIVVRVDARMAREAVRRGARIAVVATLASTLKPTYDVLLATAHAMGEVRTVTANLAEGAYEALMNGDQVTHDERVAAAITDAAGQGDVIVLAQASMARVLPRIAEDARAKCLTSPPLAVESVAEALA